MLAWMPTSKSVDQVRPSKYQMETELHVVLVLQHPNFLQHRPRPHRLCSGVHEHIPNSFLCPDTVIACSRSSSLSENISICRRKLPDPSEE